LDKGVFINTPIEQHVSLLTWTDETQTIIQKQGVAFLYKLKSFFSRVGEGGAGAGPAAADSSSRQMLFHNETNQFQLLHRVKINQRDFHYKRKSR
jgi:hypothetical protein